MFTLWPGWGLTHTGSISLSLMFLWLFNGLLHLCPFVCLEVLVTEVLASGVTAAWCVLSVFCWWLGSWSLVV